MAESLGAAVLTVSVDDRQFQAGLNSIRQSAQSTAARLGQAFAGAGGQSLTSLNIKLNSLQQELQSVAIGTRRFRELREEIEKTQRALNKANGGGGAGVLGGIGTALAGLGIGAAGIGFLRGSIDAAVELDSITRKLSNTLGPQGAGQALSFTKGLSDQLGLSFKTLASSFGSFTAAATAANVPLQEQQQLFAAVAKAAQALGLSNDEINGSLLALQQVAAKGTVQMEELRGQLGERLPIAFGATARGLGITQQELIKLVETGRLTASEFFPALTKGLNELTAGAGGTETAAQNFQKLANAWDELQTSFGQNLLPSILPQLERLTKALEGIGVVTRANKLGLGGGAITNALGVIPDQGAEAVGALKALQTQFSLTEKQANALFTDAVASVGGRTNAFGQLTLSAEQFETVLERLPGLAEQFRAKNKDVVGDLKAQQAEAARILQEELKRRDNLANLQEKLKALNAERLVVEIDSSRFREVTAEIEKLQKRLEEINKKPADSLFSLKGAAANIQEFEDLQSRLDVGTATFARLDRAIVDSTSELRALEQTAAEIRFDSIAEGLDVGTVSKSVNNLTDQLKAAQSVLDNLDFSVKPVVDPGVFQDLKKEFVQGFQSLTLDAGLTEAEIPGLGQYVKDFALANNIGVSLKVDDTAVRAAIENLLRVEEELAQLDGKKAIITVEQILEGIDDGTLTNNFNNLERRVQAATTALKAAEFGSDAFFKSLRAAQEATFELDQRNKEFDPSAFIKAAEEGRKAYEELGKASVKAADDAKSAANSLRSGLEGSFDLLTSGQQDRLLNAARADVRRAVGAGFFDSSKADRLTGKDLLSAGSQARTVLEADDRLLKVNTALAQATNKLAEKNWNVNVAVNANTGKYAVQLG